MKKFSLVLLFIGVIAGACQQKTDSYKKAIIDFVQIRNGIKTNLDIQVTDITEKDITVADSIKIFEEQYNKEKTAKVESAEKRVAYLENAISEQKAEGGIVANALVGSFTSKLGKAQQELEEAKAWEPSYLQKYSNQNPNTVLAKLVSCHLSWMNPKLNVRQEMDGSLLFTADGKSIIRTIN